MALNDINKVGLIAAKAATKEMLATLDTSALYLLHKSFKDQTTDYFKQVCKVTDFVADIALLLPIEDRKEFIDNFVEEIKNNLNRKLDEDVFKTTVSDTKSNPLDGLVKNSKALKPNEVKQLFKIVGGMLQKKGWKPSDSQKERLETELKDFFEPLGFDVNLDFRGENTTCEEKEKQKPIEEIKGEPDYLKGVVDRINDFKESEAWNA